MTSPGDFIHEKFPYLKESDIIALFSIIEFKQFAPGEVIVREGEYNYNLMIVTQGLLRNYVLDNDQDEITVLFTKEGQITTNYASVLFNQPSTEFVVAMESTVVGLCDHKLLEELSENNINLMKLQRDGFRENLMNEIKKNQSHTTLSAEERYLDFVKNNSDLFQRVPLKHIATYLGVTDISLSRMRKRIIEKEKAANI